MNGHTEISMLSCCLEREFNNWIRAGAEGILNCLNIRIPDVCKADEYNWWPKENPGTSGIETGT